VGCTFRFASLNFNDVSRFIAKHPCANQQVAVHAVCFLLNKLLCLWQAAAGIYTPGFEGKSAGV
jgi:hypothetical protein